MRRITRENERFERDFWKSEDIDTFYESRGRSDLPAAKVLAAGIAEWRRSTAGKALDKDGTRARLAVAMQSAVAAETDRLASNLNILATVGSVAPFVGLFGTVLGIMVSFSRIAQEKSTSLDVVAPGHRRGFVRDRDRPVRGDPGGGRLQSLQLRHQPPRSPPPALRRRLPRHAEPRIGDGGMILPETFGTRSLVEGRPRPPCTPPPPSAASPNGEDF